MSIHGVDDGIVTGLLFARICCNTNNNRAANYLSIRL